MTPAIATTATINARRGSGAIQQGKVGIMGKATGTIARAEQRLRDAKKAMVEIDETLQAFAAEQWPVSPSLLKSQAAAKAELRAAELAERFGHKPGTPETYAALEAIPTNRRQSPITRMYEAGAINDEQLRAAEEIATVAEMIERTVSVRGASLEARVDNAGAGRDVLIESLARVRLEVAYSSWRDRLPTPKRMVLDMVITNRPLVATARVYGVPWRKARAALIHALDRWTDIKEHVWNRIDEEDVRSIYARIGCGSLMPPRVKAERYHEDGEPE